MVADQFEITLTDMAHGGEALGRHDGQVVFIAGAIPGERVLARLTDVRKRFARADLVEVLEPSPERVKPPCRHFGVCGGCHWQHIRYEAQLGLKRQIVGAALGRIGGLLDAPVSPTIGMAEPWHYRNHVRFTIAPDGSLGFLAARSHQVVPIEECYLPHPILEDVLASLDLELSDLERLSVRAGVNTGDQMLILELATAELPELELDTPVSCVVLTPDGLPLVLAGRDSFVEELAGRRFKVSAESFFQVNTEGAAHLVRLVTEALAPKADDVLLDLYSGVGVLGLSLAQRVGSVIGVEEDPMAVDDALFNAGSAENISIIEGRAEDVLSSLERPVDLAVLDPPRAGATPEVLRALASLAPRTIAYVSCDPASLARDLARLLEGGYRVRGVWLVDMFPQTYHVECVVALDRA